MKLGEVLAGAPLRRPLTPEWAGLEIAGLEYDSRRSGSGFAFFPIAGAHADGHRFIPDVLSRGAAAIVSEQPAPSSFSGCWVEVAHSRHALASSSRAFYRYPDRRVAFNGITGTNGKSTVAYLTEAIFGAARQVTGLIGTIEYRLAGESRPAVNTTPESLDIARFADELAGRGGTQLISEVSSHALALGRVHGFEFHTAAFTNLTRDHLDYHGTMELYLAAKRLLFAPESGPAPKWMVANADDPVAKEIVAGSGNVIWYGAGSSKSVNLRAEGVKTGFDGTRFRLNWQGAQQAIESPMVGGFNVSNILAAAGIGISHGLALDVIARGIGACTAVPGRFERVDCGQPFLVVVDYAHTDDALRNVIQTARGLLKSKQGARVITLFGCGGDRDRTKRPLMAMAAAELSDYVVLTSDNPRSEDPLDIMNDALVGLRRFDTPHAAEPDRATAIRTAIGYANPGDIVILAGKGHETCQVLQDQTIHFDDREMARSILASHGYTAASGGTK